MLRWVHRIYQQNNNACKLYFCPYVVYTLVVWLEFNIVIDERGQF